MFHFFKNIQTKFCGLEDHYRDNEAGKLITWNPSEASDKLVAQCLGYDLIVTHGAKGEYGHIHHKFVHDVKSGLEPVSPEPATKGSDSPVLPT